jgi:hypothetical protein
MATIPEELNEAELAHEVLNAPTTIDHVISALSRARDLAEAQQVVTSFSSEEALNNSRHEVVKALNGLIHSLQKGVATPGIIGKGKSAVEDWVRELTRVALQGTL